jgi:hypothetical protein
MKPEGMPARSAAVGVFSALDWNEIDRALRPAFERLAKDVLRARPDVDVQYGRNMGDGSWIFAYAAFEAPGDPAFDSVLASVIFDSGLPGEEDEMIWVYGNLSTEVAARFYFHTHKIRTSGSQSALCAAAVAVAERLAEQSEIVVANLEHLQLDP